MSATDLAKAARQNAIVLRSAEFRRGREEAWRQLDDLVSRVERGGMSGLSEEEVERLPLLYRAAVSSLSVARTIVLDRNLLLYLENLALRAYLVVYGPRRGVLASVRGFLLEGFPAAVRRMRAHILIAFLVLVVAACAGYVLVRSDVSYFDTLVPEGLAQGRGPGTSTQELVEDELFAPWPGFVRAFVVFANSLFRHNAIVGIFSFGLGFALGLPTLALVAYNGLILGAFLALHVMHGLGIDFVGWLLIHGVTEFLAVLLCAGAGLTVAAQILFPGPLSRMDALAGEGRRAASVVAGAVGMFFVAGILEGGFRQLIAVTSLRYAFAFATAVLWLAYFARGGRREGAGR